MPTIGSLLSEHNGVSYLKKSGPGTLCRLAGEVYAQGRSAVLLPKSQDEFLAWRTLLPLFLQHEADPKTAKFLPVWEQPWLAFPSTGQRLGRNDRLFWADRMAALYALTDNRPRCLLVSPESLLWRNVPPDFFGRHSLELQCGADFSPDLVLEQAVEWGFERVSMVTQVGEMSQRGDILDIFLPGYNRPLRMEFFGDTIDELRLFDPESQRSVHSLKSVTILPVQPAAVGVAAQTAVEERLKELTAAKRLDENEAYAVKKDVRERGGRHICPGLLFDAASTLEAWLPENTLWLMGREADLSEALTLARAELREQLEDADTPCPQPASLALRQSAQAAPWQAFPRISAPPLVMGVESEGEDFAERSIHGFTELFPRPEDKDRPWQTLFSALKTWATEKRQVILSFTTNRSRTKFLGLAEQENIHPRTGYDPAQQGLFALVAPFRGGLELAWDNTLVLGEDILFPRAERVRREASRAFKGLDSFDGLKDGDLLVHRDYGIGRFRGLHLLTVDNVSNDFLQLEYQNGDKLYVPADRMDLVQRYHGAEGADVGLDRLGGTAWSVGRDKVRKAIEKIAADLVEMYAWRKVAKGFRYGPVGELFHEFEATFGYEETPDQARAIQDVLDDMEKSEPMDRLVCGDVGFGKTEVALRAAFRAVTEGRQVALLCPTTVLAEQHYQTFRARLAGFPVNVGLLSRFVPKKKQKEVLAAAALGQVDILVGTHRLLSSDVSLPNLALLVLDEEQRFGVRHKEKLKSLKKNVDVLTLTATPIPRTLQLSMSGIRDLSVIETAPVDRKPVATAVIQREDATLAKVIARELERDGQIFWVYNRVQGLERVAEYVQKLAPNARIGMAHGQMGETALESTMHKFWHGELDILVCTSIVESGLDFPRANTLVVDQAQNFGLGQLYQLRGRVGRSDRQAYALMVVPDASRLQPVAEERLRVILEMDYLGAGFQLAMEDLRMRGAGNILGEVQSGHMNRVGLDLYLEMLEQEVNRLKGNPLPEEEDVEVNLGIPAHIPASYIADGSERLHFYKALTSAGSPRAREEITLAMRDRFGEFPVELQHFLAVLDFRQHLGPLQIQRADIHAEYVGLSWRNGQTAVEPQAIIALVTAMPGAQIVPPAGIRLPVPQNQEQAQPLAEFLRQLGHILQERLLTKAGTC